MTLAAGYLAFNNERSKLFWVPGLLVVAVGIFTSLFNFCIDSFTGNISSDKEEIELLVELGPDDQLSEIEDILKKYHARAEKAFPNVDLDESEDLAQYYAVYVDASMKDLLELELKNDPENVDQLDINHPIVLEKPIAVEMTRKPPAQFLANDPYLTNQWYASKLDYNEVHKILKDLKPKKKVKVAIVDTGVDKDHEDISGVYTKSGTKGDSDKHSHGTHCGGLAGAATNNAKGVGSLNWDGEFITLSGFPALDDQGRGTDKKVAQSDYRCC